MRVLCSSTSGSGHWRPLVPVATALHEVGHDVLFTCPDTAAPALGALGFEVAGFDEVPERDPEQVAMFEEAGRTGNPLLAEQAIGLGFGWFSPIAALPRLQRTFEAHRPDLVLSDPGENAARTLAEAATTPLVLVMNGLGSAMAFFEGLMAAGDARLRAHLGLPPRSAPPRCEMAVTTTPPSFDTAGPFDEQLVRYRPPTLPRFRPVDRTDPLVYATLGTEVLKHFPDTPLLTTIVTALGDVGVPATLTTGVAPPQELSLPDNVEIVTFRDHREVLPRASVVVSHGGAGTVADALAAGRAQVALPQFADQFLNGERIQECGIGHCLAGEQQTPAGLAASIEQSLLGDFSDRATEMAQEIAAAHDVAALLDRLEAATSS